MSPIFPFSMMRSMKETKKKHWADEAALRVLREKGEDKALYTVAAGITPSGTVHIGNFREIITVDLVARALKRLGKRVRFIYSWDDYDVFRKVPLNMEKADELTKFLRFPITLVPDTSGRDESYARHHEVDVETSLPAVGIHPEFLYQASRYRAHRYAEGIKTALQKKERIKEILNASRDENHRMKAEDEYWPASIFCAACNKDTTRITAYDGEWRVKYECECGKGEEVDIREFSGIKLGWRVDWPMRWKEEDVAFEPGGKDHISPGGSYETASRIVKEIYGGEAPVTMRYDFVTLKGLPGKMSSSKGQVVSLQDALKVYQAEVLRFLFVSTRANTEFAISFDLDVLKIYEDYDKCERIAWGVEAAKNEETLEKAKRIYELSELTEKLPDVMPYQIGLRMLTTLLQTYSGDIEAALSSLAGVKEEQKERLYRRAECAWFWVKECAPEEFRFSLSEGGATGDLSAEEVRALKAVKDVCLPAVDEVSEKELANLLYDAAKSIQVEAKFLFQSVYKALIGKTQGPRLASFMKIIGRERLEKILGGIG